MGAANNAASNLLVRVEAEIAFAKAFADAAPAEQTAGWAERIAQADGRVDSFTADPSGGVERFVEAVETDLAPIGKAAKAYTVHCVGHGHIDMNWMWSWPETVSATHDTFVAMLEMMERFEGFTYAQSQTSVYALTERYFPELFERIKEKVEAGQWEVSAVQWVEGDKNMASGEALAHHLLYTRRFFQERFGLAPEQVQLDWEPDTFGHANTIPSILAQGGVRYYYCCRPGGGQDHVRTGVERPMLFHWDGPDGARILVNRESTWYNSYVNIGDNVALALCAFVKETGLHDWLNVFGVGNHGGGPTRKELEYLTGMRSWPIYPNVVFGTAHGFYRKVEKEIAERGLPIPVLNTELNYEFAGCYTSQSAIKRANRHGETFCVEAEGLDVVAGLHTPPERVQEAWVNVLFNQFHDILPGSGVAATRQRAMGMFQETAAITGSMKRQAGNNLSADLNTFALLPGGPVAEEEKAKVATSDVPAPFEAGSGMVAGESGLSVATTGGRRFMPFVVYNPCAFERTEFVKVSLYDVEVDPRWVVARDENGVQTPTIYLGHQEAWGHEKYDFMFPVTAVPALGYKTVLLCEGVADAKLPGARALPGQVFETDGLRLAADRFHSGFGAWQAGDLSGDFLGAWRYVHERPQGMAAWIVGKEIHDVPLETDSYRVLGGTVNEATSLPMGGGSVGYVIRHALRVPGTDSTVKTTALVHGFGHRVDFRAEVDWREIGDVKRGIPGLALDFGPFAAEAVVCETPFGSVERRPEDCPEFPSLRFVHLRGAKGGMTLLQDSKYGHAYADDRLRLRVVRSSFDPDHAPEVAKSVLRYSVVFHQDRPNPSELARLGAAWNSPLIAFPARLQSGSAPLSRSFAQEATANVVLSNLKRADDGQGVVVRLVEMDGRDTTAAVELAPAIVAGCTKAEVVDLMERPTGTPAKLTGGRLEAPVKANSFVTVKLS